MIKFRQFQGFTLIEVLVVLLIISITAGIAALTLGNNHRQVALFADELTEVLRFAEVQALLQPAIIGLSFDGTHFQFYRFNQQAKSPETQWERLATPYLKDYTLPNGVVATWQLPEKQEKSNHYPEVIFSMDGSVTPFRLFLGKENSEALYQIQGKVGGSITLEEQHETQ